MQNVKLIDHPLVQHKISMMRDINTGSKEFRELASETAMLMCYEATRDLPLKTVDIQTPVAVAKTQIISGKKIAFVPILRAGLAMTEGILELLPAAKVGHVGIFRDPETKDAVEYYCKLPVDIAEREVIITDIMLATGVTAVKTIEILKKSNVQKIKLMCIIASPEGIDAVNKAYPDVEIYCGSIDDGLNEHKYIVPGLGDAGDRIFGTK
ncbi:MAG: uracil phosphoribosyltransferase [Oscillospiraceae bacterium]